MIKKWVTVVSWQNGIALVSCDVQTSCNNCILNKLAIQTSQTIPVPSKQPLVKGQKVELGIPEKGLLISAMLIYFIPLLGLFIGAGLFQILLNTDLIAICGGILGGLSSFLLAYSFSQKLTKQKAWQPTILNVSAPPNTLLHIESFSALKSGKR